MDTSVTASQDTLAETAQLTSMNVRPILVETMDPALMVIIQPKTYEIFMILPGINSYKCKCDGGYDGDKCQIEIDECDAKPCQNGGECYDSINKYLCVCLNGFTGKLIIRLFQ